jgi:cell filamentation protein, protein adenylyltransferase
MRNFKSGAYTQQYKYKSFTPSRLTPFKWESDKVLSLLTKASQTLGELNAFAHLVPDINFFIEMHKIKEATTSSHIEGTQTTIDEVLLSERDIEPERRDDWLEVQNYIDALNYSIERINDLPLSTRLIKEAHKRLLTGVRGENKSPGEIRTSQNWIGGANIASAVFVPPHPSNVSEALFDLEKFWHNQDWELPALIRIALSHYQFEAIHPFLDGNGRMGRLLITLQLLQYDLLDKPVLYLSDFFDRNRGAYYDALIRVTNSNDIGQWIRFFLTGVIDTAKKGKETFVQNGVLRKTYSKSLTKLGRRERLGNQLLEFLYSNPVISPRKVEELLSVTPATANRLLKEMDKVGILKEATGYARNRIYILHEYLQIFKN